MSTIQSTSGISADNFSYSTVSVAVKIPQHQQMIVYQAIDIIGELELVGDLVLIDV